MMIVRMSRRTHSFRLNMATATQASTALDRLLSEEHAAFREPAGPSGAKNVVLDQTISGRSAIRAEPTNAASALSSSGVKNWKKIGPHTSWVDTASSTAPAAFRLR